MVAEIAGIGANRYAVGDCQRAYALIADAYGAAAVGIQIDRDILIGLTVEDNLLLRGMVVVEDEVDVAHQAIRVDRSGAVKLAGGGPQRFCLQRPVIKMDTAAASRDRPTKVERPTSTAPPSRTLSMPAPLKPTFRVVGERPLGIGAFDGPLAGRAE